MFTGSLAPANENINSAINSIDIASLRRPFDLPTDRQKIERWLVESKRVDLIGLDQLKHFSFSAGNLDSLTSFIHNKQLLFMPKKMYYYHGEVLTDKNLIVCNPWGPPIGLYANVLFEYPSPWYTIEELDEKIAELMLEMKIVDGELIDDSKKIVSSKAQSTKGSPKKHSKAN